MTAKEFRKLQAGNFEMPARRYVMQVLLNADPIASYEPLIGIKSADDNAAILREIGNRVRHLREHRGLCKQYAASAIGMKADEWAAIEAGKVEPTAGQGLAMALLFNVAPVWISPPGVNVSQKRIDDVLANKGKPPTIREALGFARVLDTTPHFLQWGKAD